MGKRGGEGACARVHWHVGGSLNRPAAAEALSKAFRVLAGLCVILGFAAGFAMLGRWGRWSLFGAAGVGVSLAVGFWAVAFFLRLWARGEQE